MLAVICDTGYFPFSSFKLVLFYCYFIFDSANLFIVNPVPSSLYRMLAEYASILTLAISILLQKLTWLEVMVKRRSSATGMGLEIFV
jgi:hypothetical protein